MTSSLHALQYTQGSRGLSLFFLRVRDEEGKLNGIQVQRLKDKLGTRQMATAELWLQGARAELVCKSSWGLGCPGDWAALTWHALLGLSAMIPTEKVPLFHLSGLAVHRTIH